MPLCRTYLATVLLTLLLAVPAISVELFRYRYNGEDRAEYEAVFETDERSVGKTVDKEKAEEIAMAWMQVFYGEQVGTIESQELKTTPLPHWLFHLTGDDTESANHLLTGLRIFPRGLDRLRDKREWL